MVNRSINALALVRDIGSSIAGSDETHALFSFVTDYCLERILSVNFVGVVGENLEPSPSGLVPTILIPGIGECKMGLPHYVLAPMCLCTCDFSM